MKKKPVVLQKYSTIEITLCGHNLLPKEKEAARAFFMSCRIRERDLAVAERKGAYGLSFYTRSMRKVREIQKKYRTSADRPFAFQWKILRRRDWFDKWKENYHIQSLGAKFVIVPVLEKQKFKPKRYKRIPIFLEPGSAFGSGYHETTRLMTQLLESLAGKIKSFLDVGCGTGILSVVAAKLGAEKILGFDHDRPSALVARKNFQFNLCRGGTFLCAHLKGPKISGYFDAVGANLLSKTLLEHRARLVARVCPGGYLLVSGIALQNFDSFKRGFSGASLRCQKILRGRRWAAVLFKRGQAVN